MSASSLRRAWALCAAALLALAAPAAAQAVIGELVERTTGAPVGGAVVVLLDAEGTQRASALTGPTGVFALRAPAPGTYRLRAERVGYASTLSPPLELAAGQTVRHRLVSAEAAVQLDALAATGTRRGCRVRPGAGEATAALWEEARKALNAAAHVEEAGRLRYDVEIHQRELDPVSLAVLKDERRRGTSVERSAFVSQPAEVLAREGYVRVVNQGTKDEGTDFYAPDAHVLLSDAFLDGHCFRMEERAAPSPELVGLAFEPVRRTRNADVAGVLWLDRRTSELKALEFRYTSLPVHVDPERLGGRVEFDRLETGEWFVRRWWIRMPVLGESVTHDRVAGATETFQRGGQQTLLKRRRWRRRRPGGWRGRSSIRWRAGRWRAPACSCRGRSTRRAPTRRARFRWRFPRDATR
jgi:Carboxypeptidase regulatory-like domain